MAQTYELVALSHLGPGQWTVEQPLGEFGHSGTMLGGSALDPVWSSHGVGADFRRVVVGIGGASAPGLTLVDGPSGISGTTADAIRAADVVLIPAKASPFDVWAAADIVAAVRARQESTGGPPKAAFVVTMSRHRTILGRQVESALEEYGLPAMEARTTERVSYPQTAAEGRSVLDGRDRTARREILDLRDEIERLINDTAR